MGRLLNCSNSLFLIKRLVFGHSCSQNASFVSGKSYPLNSLRGCLVNKFISKFLPRLFNLEFREVTAHWSRGWVKNQVWTNQNSRNNWYRIVRRTHFTRDLGFYGSLAPGSLMSRWNHTLSQGLSESKRLKELSKAVIWNFWIWSANFLYHGSTTVFHGIIWVELILTDA